jgi:hypothetical protein
VLNHNTKIILLSMISLSCCMISPSIANIGFSQAGKRDKAIWNSRRPSSKTLFKGSICADVSNDQEVNVAGALERARKIGGARYLPKLLSSPIWSDETEEQDAQGLPVSFLSIIARIETEDAAPPPFTDGTIPSMTTWSDDVSEAGIVPELLNSSPPGVLVVRRNKKNNLFIIQGVMYAP